jgi:hypothetical protein
MQNKNLWKFIDLLYGISIILLIATAIRTLAYLIVGLQTERIFRNDLIILWIIIISIIIFRNVAKAIILKKNKY